METALAIRPAPEEPASTQPIRPAGVVDWFPRFNDLPKELRLKVLHFVSNFMVETAFS